MARRLTPGALLCLDVMVRLATPRGLVKATLTEVAKECGADRRSVMRWVLLLSDAGVVQRVGGGGPARRYFVRLLRHDVPVCPECGGPIPQTGGLQRGGIHGGFTPKGARKDVEPTPVVRSRCPQCQQTLRFDREWQVTALDMGLRGKSPAAIHKATKRPLLDFDEEGKRREGVVAFLLRNFPQTYSADYGHLSGKSQRNGQRSVVDD